MRDLPARVKRKHASGNTFQDRLDVPPALLKRDVRRAQISAGSLNLLTVGLQLLRHAVERADEIPHFIRRADFHAVVKASPGDFLRRFRQRSDRSRDQLGKK